MPMLDAVFVGKIYLPEISTGPLPPGPGTPPGVGIAPPIYYPPVFPAHPIAGPPEWGHHPAHPIAGPPEWGHHPAHPIAPGGPPPGIWGPPTIGHHPAHPIVLPPPGRPDAPPDGNGRWAYSPIYGWVWLPGNSGGKPQPPGGQPPTTEPPPDPNAPTVTPHA
jgi:hypothetical protein